MYSYEGGGAVSEEQTLAVEVSAIERLTPLIKHFTLAPVGGGSAPASDRSRSQRM